MLKCAGRFFYLPTMSQTRQPFQKHYTNPHDLVSLLKQRGLIITDEAKAEHYLMNIGYYRLSAYMYPLLSFPKERHIYKPGSTFSKVMMLYRFDKKLRMFIFNEIEKIEVAVKSAIVNIGSEMTGDPFWTTTSSNFVDQSKFSRTMTLINGELHHTREEFINHFRQAYTDPYPPAWMLAEILPFGIITNIFSNIKDMKIRKRIAQHFGLQPTPFESWLTIVTLTRNACCHHSRVWNKQNTIRATLPRHMNRPWITIPTDVLRIYFNLCIIKYFLGIISPNNDMLQKVQNLLAAFPDVDTAAMGFPTGWENEPLWNN